MSAIVAIIVPFLIDQEYSRNAGFLVPINQFSAPNGVERTFEIAPFGAIFL